MAKQVVEITVKKDGTFTFQAKEGFQGSSCVNETKNLEMVLGGQVVSKEKTKDYYDGGSMNRNIDLKL